MSEDRYTFSAVQKAKTELLDLNQQHNGVVERKVKQFNRLSTPSQRKFVEHLKNSSTSLMFEKNIYLFPLLGTNKNAALWINDASKAVMCIDVKDLQAA